MKIAYNPKSAGPLNVAPTGDYLNAITFDLAAHNIYTRGELFKGTDTTYEVFKKAAQQDAEGYNGLVPAPSYTDKSVRFLREDGTWNIPHQRPIKLGGGDFITEEDYNKPLDIHSGDFISITHNDETGQITISSTLEFEGDFDGTVPVAFTKAKVGSKELKAITNTTLSFAEGTGISLTPNTTTNTILVAAPVFKGATTTKDGTLGIVPQPKKANTISYLRGDGTWQNLTTDLIVALTSYSNNYTLALDSVNLTTTDTLNLALAKLEHKANKGVYAYDWVISVTTEDADLYINKWLEIVDFLNKVDNSEGADITDEFVTRKTDLSIIGMKTFEAATVINNTLAVNNNLTVKGNINPKVNNTYTLGTTSLQWKNIYSVLGTFSGNVSSDGFIKHDSSDSYLLLGGGGHKLISDFLLKEEELTNNVTIKTVSLSATSNWSNVTGISGNFLETGTYIILVEANTSTMSNCYWSGVMSWYSGTTNDTESDEILLHRTGGSYSLTIYLRTLMDGGSLKLLIAANTSIGSTSYTFKFKRIL